jgi:hypothetical protein
MVQEDPLIIAIGVVTIAVMEAEKFRLHRMGFLPASSVQAASFSLTA